MVIYNWGLLIIGCLAGFVLFYKKETLEKVSYVNEGRKRRKKIKISIIIPVRNEERNIGHLLDCLMKNRYPLHEIICVNDGSIDETVSIISQYPVRILEITEPSNGWRGKTWACQCGAKEATGELLLFIDADVSMSADSIGKLVNQYEKERKPISVQPYHLVQKGYENISLIFNLIQIASTGMAVIHHKKSMGFYGPVLMLEKEMFFRMGGYEKVKEEVVEDYLLGRKFNATGIFFHLYMGYPDISFRMYPQGLKQLLEGWSKNYSKAAGKAKWWIFILIFIWLTSITALPFYIVKWGMNENFMTCAMSILIYFGMVFVMYSIGKKMGSFSIICYLCFPVFVLCFHLIFIYSLLASFVFKNTTWKGRKL